MKLPAGNFNSLPAATQGYHQRAASKNNMTLWLGMGAALVSLLLVICTVIAFSMSDQAGDMMKSALVTPSSTSPNPSSKQPGLNDRYVPDFSSSKSKPEKSNLNSTVQFETKADPFDTTPPKKPAASTADAEVTETKKSVPNDAIQWGSDGPATTSGDGDAEWGSGDLRIAFKDTKGITFGPIGCPIVIVGDEIWHLEEKRMRGILQGERHRGAETALSSSGRWFASADKSANQKETTVRVWDTTTGDSVFEVPSDEETYTDFIRFSRDKYLLLGGRSSEEIQVYDVSVGKQISTMKTGLRRVEDEKITLTGDGRYFARIADDRLSVAATKSGRAVAVMEMPPLKSVTDGLNPTQKRLTRNRVISDVKLLRFSPNGQELAAISRGTDGPRLLCWNSKGKLVFDQVFPRIAHTFFFRPTLAWLPDSSGWIVSGFIVERRSQKVVFSIRLGFAKDPIFFPLDRERLVGAFPNDPKTLQVLNIPWQDIDRSVDMMMNQDSALLSPTKPVRLQVELEGLRGNASETKKRIEDVVKKRLSLDGLQLSDSGRLTFLVRFSENAGDSLPVYERQSRFDFRGRDTGRTVKEAKGSIVMELLNEDKVLWRDTIDAASSRSFREDINDASVRKSMLDNLTRQVNRIGIPYYIPKSDDQLALPIVVE